MSIADELSQMAVARREDLQGKRVLLRLDLNVPIRDGRIHNDARLRASLTAVRSLLRRQARLMIMSHLGRPGSGDEERRKTSLAPIAAWLRRELQAEIPLCVDWHETPPQVNSGEAVLLENVRFHPEEIENGDNLGRYLGSICDLYVMDAFAVCHRANASTEAVIRHAPDVCAGPLLLAEIEAVSQLMDSARSPVITIASGAKISDKLPLLRSLVRVSDCLIPGGGIANTLLAAQGVKVGASLHQSNMQAQALEIMRQTEVLLPEWVVTAAPPASPDGDFSEIGIEHIHALDGSRVVMDVAPRSVLQWEQRLLQAGTLLWNGPLGMFENPAFAAGTIALGEILSRCSGFTLAGGGDTISAVEMCGVQDQLSYLSTGGGAFLAALEGRSLPAIEAMREARRQHLHR